MNTITAVGASHKVSTLEGRVTRTRLRITKRGRRVVAFLAAMPIAAGVAAVIINGGAAIGSNEAGAPAGSFEVVTVMPGETLWSIAEQVAPAEDPRGVVDEISELNNLASAALDTGQRLFLPIAYSAGH